MFFSKKCELTWAEKRGERIRKREKVPPTSFPEVSHLHWLYIYMGANNGAGCFNADKEENWVDQKML